MNRQEYNRMIEETLKTKPAQTGDALATARAVFNHMGISLPQGDLRQVSEALATDDYMGWRKCTAEEAQTAANDGTAAVAFAGDTVVMVMAEADDEDEIVTATPVDEASTVAQIAQREGIQYYSYSAATTYYPIDDSELICNKPYDPFYPYYNIQTSEQYYQVLSTYDYELRNEVIFDFTSSEIAAFRDKLDSLYYSTMDEKNSIWSSMVDVLVEGLGYVPIIGTLVSAFSTGATLSEIGKSNNKENYHNLLGVIYDVLHYDNHVEKDSSYLYSLSLLQPSPYGGWELQFRCDSDGEKRIFQLNEAVYHLVFVAAAYHGFTRVIYKVAPQYSYHWE